MPPSTPDVSVITPVHNAAEFLPACLRSLLEQTFIGTLQLCVYDDASTDDSRQVLAHPHPAIGMYWPCFFYCDKI